jgi:alkylation response protein AidB-like acyl-CoA dehydrogenase
MDSTRGALDDEFRSEIRSWLADHLTDDLRAIGRTSLASHETWSQRVAWERELASGRWVGVSWPASAGGRGVSSVQRMIFDEEYAAADAPPRAGFFGEQLLGPTMILHGTEQQRQRFLPAILRGETFWCQGYSEPCAGSDLASVATRAVRDGNEWVIDGQKIWTSLAQFADWIFLLCRTDPDAPRHRGLSLLLCPLRQPGVEVRPIRQLTGDCEFNEVFFDGARTDADMVLGGEGAGWQVAMSVLGYERGTAFLAQQRDFVREYTATLARIQSRGAAGDPVVRQQLARAWTGLEIMRFTGLRTLSAVAGGRTPGPEVSIGKLFWSHWHQKMVELAMDLSGPDSMVLDGGRLDHLQHGFLFSRQDTIAAGSSEIQRNIIGQRVLGLPPERRQSVE